MSKFVKATAFETVYEGDTVRAMLAPLTLPDAMRLEDLVADTTKADEFLRFLVDLLPRYVSDFDGLRDAGGNKLTIGDVVGHRYFMALLQEIGFALLKASLPPHPSKPVEESGDSSAGNDSPTNGG